MVKANLFLIGAPKCGTTSIAENLAHHPNIFMSNPKEPYYFEYDIGRGIRTLKDYQKLFKDVNEKEIVVAEASTGYLYSECAVDEIIKYNCDAKFIVILRSPYEMAMSLYTHACRGGYENLNSFDEAWFAQPERSTLKNIPDGCVSYRLLMYRDRCAVGSQLERLFSKVEMAKIKVLFFDDLRDDSINLYEDIFAFLEVPSVALDHNKKSNQKRRSTFPLANKFIRYLGKGKRKLGLLSSWGLAHNVADFFSSRKFPDTDLNKSTIDSMILSFNPEIDIIESLSGRDLSHWKK